MEVTLSCSSLAAVTVRSFDTKRAGMKISRRLSIVCPFAAVPAQAVLVAVAAAAAALRASAAATTASAVAAPAAA